MHGCDRRPVGDSRTGIPTEATVRLAGTTLARHAVGAQWRALDSAHRRPVARTSLQVSALSDLSSAFPILAAFGVADPRAAKTGRGLTRPRPEKHSRRPGVATLLPPLENRTAVCLAA